MTRSILCTVAALGLLTGTALAQNAAKPAAGAEAPAAGGAAGEPKLPPGQAPRGAEKMPGATGGAASPGMKSNAGETEAQPGQRQKGENAGAEPKKPTRPEAGEPKQGTKAGTAEEQQRTKAGATPEKQPAQNAGEAKPAGAAKPAAAGEAKPAAAGEARPAGAARPAPRLTTEQTTRVKTVFRSVNVRPVHVDFRVSVGVAVPRTVVLEPVPREIVTIVPEYEGFRFFEVPGEIIIVDPDTLEIVYILPL